MPKEKDLPIAADIAGVRVLQKDGKSANAPIEAVKEVIGGLEYTLPAATASELGGIKVGEGLEIAEDGTLSASGDKLPGEEYVLPPATPTTLGGVKVGEGLKVDETGTISTDTDGSIGGSLPKASATTLGGIKVGKNLSIREDGTLDANGDSADSELPSFTIRGYLPEADRENEITQCLAAYHANPKLQIYFCFSEGEPCYSVQIQELTSPEGIKVSFISTVAPGLSDMGYGSVSSLRMARIVLMVVPEEGTSLLWDFDEAPLSTGIRSPLISGDETPEQQMEKINSLFTKYRKSPLGECAYETPLYISIDGHSCPVSHVLNGSHFTISASYMYTLQGELRLRYFTAAGAVGYNEIHQVVAKSITTWEKGEKIFTN